MIKLLTIFAVLGLGCVLPLSASGACVDPGKAGCFTSIQAAVDAAVAGETIDVSADTYFETVSIPSGLDGLVISGSSRSRTVIDPDNPNNGDGIEVLSDDVTVEKLTIRNGDQHGINIGDGVSDTTISNVSVTGVNRDCIRTDGTGTSIDRVILLGCGRQGINAASGMNPADNVSVRRARIRHTVNAGIVIIGDDAVIERTEIEVVGGGDCVSITGSDATVSKLDISGCDAVGVSISGDGASVDGCKIRATRDSAVIVDGSNPSVTKNRVEASGGAALVDAGIDVDCDPCTGGEVSSNRVRDTIRSAGIKISAAAPGGILVEKNRVERAAEAGFELSGTNIRAVKNQAKAGGGAGGSAGYEIEGASHTIEANFARNNHGDGFDIEGSDHVIIDNKAFDNVEDGFDIGVFGMDVALTDNTAMRNAAEGFEISSGANDTVLDGNRGLKNRLDLCDDGADTVVAADNRFDTSGGCELN